MLLVVENSVFDLELSHKGQDNTVKGEKTFFYFCACFTEYLAKCK